MLQVTVPNPNAKLDFSARGTPIESVSDNLPDFSSRGTPIETIPQQTVSPLASAVRGAVGAATMGLGESTPINSAAIGLIGGLGARAYSAMTGQDLFPEPIEQTVGEAQQIAQIQGEQAQEQHPIAYMAGGLPAGVAAAEGLATQFPKVFGAAQPQATLIPRLVQNAKAGLTLGAAQGALSTPGDIIDRLGGAALGGAVGAPLGAIGGEIGRAIGKGINYARGTSGEIPAANEAEKEFIKQNYARDELLAQTPEARARMTQAKDLGITLTPAEAYGDPAMLAQQAALMKQPGSAAAAQGLKNLRQDVQLPTAMESQIKSISPVASPQEAGQALINGAQNLEAQVRSDLSTKAAPYYEAAYSFGQIPKNDPILKNDRVKDYLKIVRRDFPELKDLPNNSIQVLDEVKKLMDGDISSALSGASPDRNAARLIGKAKSSLLDVMDNSSKVYSQARRIYAEGAPEIENLVKGRVGALAKVKDINAYKAPQQLMTGSAEQTQEVAQKLPEEAKAAAAGILQTAVQGLKGEPFENVQKRVFATPKQQEQFKAMLGNKYEPFARLMDITQRVGVGQQAMKGLPTTGAQPTQYDLGQMAIQAKTNPVGFAKSLVSGLFGVTTETRTMAENKKYADLAKILLTERGIELMDTIAELKPSAEQARRLLGLSQTAGIVGATTTGTQKTKGALKVKYDSTNK